MNILDVVSKEETRQNDKAEAAKIREAIAPNQTLTIADRMSLEANLCPISQFPDYTEEKDNPEILIKGRWLERTGSAWIISTAGTGKSIHSIQLAFCLSAGLPFGGLTPNIVNDHNLRFWIIQSEDSPSRVTIDREDIMAELIEMYPDTNWKRVAESIMFVNTQGKIGAELINYLDGMMRAAQSFGMCPDILIINPFMAFVGGPITDGSYVTPFLRGGEINHVRTGGLQGLLTRHNVAALIYHHTPKPPKEAEISAWLKSPFPEYQGAGSADITNWGRSFITMQKVPKCSRTICMTAGKNGGDLGWSELAGARKHYLIWSGKDGIVRGSLRHAWRELTEEEYTEATGEERADFDSRVSACVAEAVNHMHKGQAYYRDQFVDELRRHTKRVTAKAWTLMTSGECAKTYHYQIQSIVWGRTCRKYIGYKSALDTILKQSIQQARIEAGKIDPPARGEYVLPEDIANNDTLNNLINQSNQEQKGGD